MEGTATTRRKVRGPARDRTGVGFVEVLPSGGFRARVWVGGSAPWSRAVAVVEGGPLRMRHAVELAGLVMEAAEVTGEGMTG